MDPSQLSLVEVFAEPESLQSNNLRLLAFDEFGALESETWRGCVRNPSQ